MSDVPETERRRREDMHFLLTELNVLRLRVQGMESSKFWKLREAWFVVKRRLRLGRRTNEG
jgi:hypothetical protein